MFFLVLAHPDSPGQRAVKWSLLLMLDYWLDIVLEMVDPPDATTAVTRTTTAVTCTSVTTRNTGMSPIAMPSVLQPSHRMPP